MGPILVRQAGKWRKWRETRFFHFADEMLADSRVRARTHTRTRA